MSADIVRKRQLAQVHVLQKQLGMSREDASALKVGLTGVASAGDMTAKQLDALVSHMMQLLQRSGVVATPKPRRADKLDAQDKVIWALWMTLVDSGKANGRSMAAIDAYAKRQTGVDKMTWCTKPQKQLVIESLKQWSKRK